MLKDTDIAISELLETLCTLAGKRTVCTTESDGSNHSLECDDFDIAFVLDDIDDTLQISRLEIHMNRTLGRRIINVVHRFADEHHLGLTAAGVRDEAIGFWREMGYVECSSTDGEFFRAK